MLESNTISPWHLEHALHFLHRFQQAAVLCGMLCQMSSMALLELSGSLSLLLFPVITWEAEEAQL